MNQYEVMYVIDPTLDDGARVELINRFSELVKKNGGEVDRVDEWGKRRLAYAINYKTEGYYVLMYIKAPSSLPQELERNLAVDAAPAVVETETVVATEVVDEEAPVSEAE